MLKQYTNLISFAEYFGHIHTKRELAMFLTQVLWESNGLRAVEEYACIYTKCPNQYISAKDFLNQHYYGLKLIVENYLVVKYC